MNDPPVAVGLEPPDAADRAAGSGGTDATTLSSKASDVGQLRGAGVRASAIARTAPRRAPATVPARGPKVVDLRSPLELFPMPMLLCDAEGRARSANTPWLDLSGLGRGTWRDHGWLAVFDAQDRPDALELVSAAATAQTPVSVEFRLTLRGERRWTRWWIQHLGREGLVALAVADVEADHVLLDQLLHRATHDPLTGVADRAHLFEILVQALRSRARHPSHLAVLYVDLDDFKAVNDRYGHAVGDLVLITTAEALIHAVRPDDVVARVGGDEFAVLCDHLDDPEDAELIVERLHDALTTPVRVGRSHLSVTASVGVAFASGSDESAEELVDRADRAMYRMKHAHPADGGRFATADEQDRSDDRTA